VAVTTSSADRGARLRDLGATRVLDRAGRGDPDAPSGFDVIVDVVGGPDLASFFDRLNPNGRLVTVGVVGGFPPPDFAAPMFPAFQKSQTFSTFSADTVPMAERLALIADLFALVGRGELRAVVHQVLPLDQAVVAHQKMGAGEVFGKLVLVP